MALTIIHSMLGLRQQQNVSARWVARKEALGRTDEKDTYQDMSQDR